MIQLLQVSVNVYVVSEPPSVKRHGKTFDVNTYIRNKLFIIFSSPCDVLMCILLYRHTVLKIKNSENIITII